MYLALLIFFMVFIFWGIALYLFLNRNSLDKLNMVFPLMTIYRNRRLHPLFRYPKDAAGLAGWFFGLGLLVLGLYLAQQFGFL